MHDTGTDFYVAAVVLVGLGNSKWNLMSLDMQSQSLLALAANMWARKMDLI